MHSFAILLGRVEAIAMLLSEETLDFATQSNVFWPIYGSLLVLTAAGVWATFVKAGQHGWTCIIPFYNLVILLRIVRTHPLWMVVFLLPLVNTVFACFIAIRLAQRFGKGIGFGLGLIFLPFIYYPVLGFGSAKYQVSGAETKGVRPPGDARPASQLHYRKAG